MRLVAFGAGLLLAGASGSAAAADRQAIGAITAGDYDTAERTLSSERRIFPQRPELMLNLAAVYRQTGRDAAARELYADILAREDVPMNTLNQSTSSSHTIAKAGLARLTQVATR